MIPIPGQNGWTTNRDSDTLGSYVGGMNLDLTTNKNAVRLWPRMKIGTDDITDLGVAVGFERFNSTSTGFWTVAGSYVFKTSSVDASAAFAKDAQSGTPTACSSDVSDIIFFRKANKLVVTTQTDIYYNSGSGSWNDVTGTILSSGNPHLLTQYGNRAYVVDEYKKIYSLDTSMTPATSGANTFVLDTYSSNNVGLGISKILGAGDKIWIFTINYAVGQPARVFTWDGATENTPLNSQGYVLDSGGVWTATLVNDTPYIINVEGRLQQFASATFVDVPNGRLPFNTFKYLKNAFSGVNDRPVHPNGLTVVPGNKLRVLVNNVYEDGTIDEFFPSGIYEFDLTNTAKGWYPICSPSLYASSITDYGQNRVSRVGGMLYAKTPSGDGMNLIGAQIYSDASTTKEIIATEDTDDTLQKFGYIVTMKVSASSIEDEYHKAYVRNKKLLDASDAIWVKYRVSEIEPVEATITWTSTTTFTTSTNVSAYKYYEFEGIQGKGSGKCSKITDVTESGGTYTVTLQETFTGCTSGTAKGRFQYWKEIGKLTKQDKDFFESSITSPQTFVQLKICMQFTGQNEVGDVLLDQTKRK